MSCIFRDRDVNVDMEEKDFDNVPVAAVTIRKAAALVKPSRHSIISPLRKLPSTESLRIISLVTHVIIFRPLLCVCRLRCPLKCAKDKDVHSVNH